jgi:hypothetical protein
MPVVPPLGQPGQVHEELYGTLLWANGVILGRPGCIFLLPLYSALVIGICSLIYMELYKLVPGMDRVEVGNPWCYALVIVIGVVLLLVHTIFYEKRWYRRVKPDILRAMQSCGISRGTLLARIEGDKALETIARMLKEDHELNER